MQVGPYCVKWIGELYLRLLCDQQRVRYSLRAVSSLLVVDRRRLVLDEATLYISPVDL